MSELSVKDLAAIQEIHDRWVSAELRGDHSRVIELCTDDVSWIPPNAPPLNGKNDIAKYLTDNAVDLKDIQVWDVVIRGNRLSAYLMSKYHTWFMFPGGSEIQEVTGTHIWFLTRTEDESWRVAVVSWSYW